MNFKPGHPKSGGRTKGIPNKTTVELRDMILGALADVGGREYLVRQARANPATFMTLLGKVLPRDVAMTVDDQRTPLPEGERQELMNWLIDQLTVRKPTALPVVPEATGNGAKH